MPSSSVWAKAKTDLPSHRLGVLDEGLRDAHLPLLLRDTGVLKDLLACCLRIALPDVLAGV